MAMKIVPELRSVQQIINVLEPHTHQERKRILIIAIALLGHDWMMSFIPSVVHRKEIDQAVKLLKKSA